MGYRLTIIHGIRGITLQLTSYGIRLSKKNKQHNGQKREYKRIKGYITLCICWLTVNCVFIKNIIFYTFSPLEHFLEIRLKKTKNPTIAPSLYYHVFKYQSLVPYLIRSFWHIKKYSTYVFTRIKRFRNIMSYSR
jgi:hypothetical protein